MNGMETRPFHKHKYIVSFFLIRTFSGYSRRDAIYRVFELLHPFHRVHCTNTNTSFRFFKFARFRDIQVETRFIASLIYRVFAFRRRDKSRLYICI